MYDENLRIAYDKSEEMLKKCAGTRGIVQIEDAVEVVKQHINGDIKIWKTSFSKARIKHRYGAMMKMELDANNMPQSAEIVLNSDNEILIQRFSLFHELGHIFTRSFNDSDIYVENNNKYVVSTHIDCNITNISKDDYTKQPFLLQEQIANIFALRVLMPSDIFFKQLKSNADAAEIAEYFGVTKDAVVSRAMLGV